MLFIPISWHNEIDLSKIPSPPKHNHFTPRGMNCPLINLRHAQTAEQPAQEITEEQAQTILPTTLHQPTNLIDLTGGEDPTQLRCPRCGEENFYEIGRVAGSMFYHCANCGYDFRMNRPSIEVRALSKESAPEDQEAETGIERLISHPQDSGEWEINEGEDSGLSIVARGKRHILILDKKSKTVQVYKLVPSDAQISPPYLVIDGKRYAPVGSHIPLPRTYSLEI